MRKEIKQLMSGTEFRRVIIRAHSALIYSDVLIGTWDLDEEFGGPYKGGLTYVDYCRQLSPMLANRPWMNREHGASLIVDDEATEQAFDDFYLARKRLRRLCRIYMRLYKTRLPKRVLDFVRLS